MLYSHLCVSITILSSLPRGLFFFVCHKLNCFLKPHFGSTGHTCKYVHLFYMKEAGAGPTTVLWHQPGGPQVTVEYHSYLTVHAQS